LFNNRKRIDAAFAKGLMFGKAVGARDERERIASYLEGRIDDLCQCHKTDNCHEIALVIEGCVEDIKDDTNER